MFEQNKAQPHTHTHSGSMAKFFLFVWMSVWIKCILLLVAYEVRDSFDLREMYKFSFLTLFRFMTGIMHYLCLMPKNIEEFIVCLFSKFIYKFFCVSCFSSHGFVFCAQCAGFWSSNGEKSPTLGVFVLRGIARQM